MPILERTSARCILVLGPARGPVGLECFGAALDSSPKRMTIAGVERIFVGLEKSGSNKPRKLPGALPRGQADLALIRTYLQPSVFTHWLLCGVAQSSLGAWTTSA